jgi:hypothetical protein
MTTTNTTLSVRELIWRVSLPAIMLSHIFIIQPLIPEGKGVNLFEGWWRLLYLVPRFALYFILSPQAPRPSKLAVYALLAETACLTFAGWMFGRSIM